MPRTKENPGTGPRLERLRARLGIAQRTFAKACVAKNAYNAWVYRDCAPSAFALKRALVALKGPEGEPLADLELLLSWLTDGDGAPPAWLLDETLSPWAHANGNGGNGGDGNGGGERQVQLELFPEPELVRLADLYLKLDRARETGELRDPLAIDAWSELARISRGLDSNYPAWTRTRNRPTERTCNVGYTAGHTAA